MQLEQMNLEQLQTEEKNLLSIHQQFLDSSLKLDLTRGKPSAEQLSLSEGMEGLLAGKMIHEDGTDLRNMEVRTGYRRPGNSEQTCWDSLPMK